MMAQEPADGSNGQADQPDAIRTTARALSVLTGVVLFVPLVLHAYLGTFSRPLADDFCTWGWLNEIGYWGSQAYWYQSWSGRFSFTALMSASHYLGLGFPRLLPGLLLGLWLVALGWAVWPFVKVRSTAFGGLLAGLLAGAFLAGVLGAAPNLYQSLYWHTGSFTYLLPLILFTFYVGWLLRRGRGSGAQERGARWAPAVTAAGLAFIAGGFSETFALLQIVLLAVVSLFFWLTDRRGEWHLASLGMIGAGLALLLVALAPGNAVRGSLVGSSGPIVVVVQRSLRNAYIFSAQMVNHHLPALLTLALVPLAVELQIGRPASLEWKKGVAGLLVVPVLAFLGVAVVMLPSEYALSSFPDGRVLVTAMFIIGVAVMLWSLLLVRTFGPKVPAGARIRTWLVIGVAVAGLVASGVQGVKAVRADLELLPDARQFSEGWDRRHRAVLEARHEGDLELAVASLSHMGGLAEIARDPNEWINRCFADAYGVRSVEAK